MTPHCAEHEVRGERLVAAEACIKNFKYNWEQGRVQMQKRSETMEQELKLKLAAATFYKVMSILVGIMIIVLGVQWNLLFAIDTKVDGIDKKQAVVIEKLEHSIKHTK